MESGTSTRRPCLYARRSWSTSSTGPKGSCRAATPSRTQRQGASTDGPPRVDARSSRERGSRDGSEREDQGATALGGVSAPARSALDGRAQEPRGGRAGSVL